MSPRTRRANRVGLVLVGLVALAAGLAGLFAGKGDLRRWIGPPAAPSFGSGHQPVLTAPEVAWVHRAGWFWPAAAAAAVVLALIGLRWLLVQLRVDRLAEIGFDDGPSGGVTVVLGDALAEAVEADVAGFDGVTSVAARVAGSETAPQLHLVVTVTDSAPLEPLRRRIADDAIAHLCCAMELPSVPTWVTFRVGAARP